MLSSDTQSFGTLLYFRIKSQGHNFVNIILENYVNKKNYNIDYNISYVHDPFIMIFLRTFKIGELFYAILLCIIFIRCVQ